jgi:hypothetical protein
MTGIEILAIAQGAVAILETVGPAIRDAVSKGEISVEAQKALKDRVDGLMGTGAFEGPEWQVEKEGIV